MTFTFRIVLIRVKKVIFHCLRLKYIIVVRHTLVQVPLLDYYKSRPAQTSNLKYDRYLNAISIQH